MQSNLNRPGGGTIAAGNRNSPPGRLRPEGSGELHLRCSLFPMHFLVLCIFFWGLASWAPAHHAPSPHEPFFLFAAGTFPFRRVRNNLRVKCWRGCCAGCKHSARPPRIPFWGVVPNVFGPFPLPFSAKIFSWFFMLFTSLFSMLFQWISDAFHITLFDAFRVRSSKNSPAEIHLFSKASFLSDMRSTQ